MEGDSRTPGRLLDGWLARRLSPELRQNPPEHDGDSHVHNKQRRDHKRASAGQLCCGRQGTSSATASGQLLAPTGSGSRRRTTGALLQCLEAELHLSNPPWGRSWGKHEAELAVRPQGRHSLCTRGRAAGASRQAAATPCSPVCPAPQAVTNSFPDITRSHVEPGGHPAPLHRRRLHTGQRCAALTPLCEQCRGHRAAERPATNSVGVPKQGWRPSRSARLFSDSAVRLAFSWPQGAAPRHQSSPQLAATDDRGECRRPAARRRRRRLPGSGVFAAAQPAHSPLLLQAAYVRKLEAELAAGGTPGSTARYGSSSGGAFGGGGSGATMSAAEHSAKDVSALVWGIACAFAVLRSQHQFSASCRRSWWRRSSACCSMRRRSPAARRSARCARARPPRWVLPAAAAAAPAAWRAPPAAALGARPAASPSAAPP